MNKKTIKIVSIVLAVAMVASFIIGIVSYFL